MKLAILTSFVLLVSLVSTSTAIPTPEASHSFEARSEELEARAPDESGGAILYAKRALWHWVAGAAVVGYGLHKWNQSRKAKNQNNPPNQRNMGPPPAGNNGAGNDQNYQSNSQGYTGSQDSSDASGDYKRDLPSDAFGGLD